MLDAALGWLLLGCLAALVIALASVRDRVRTWWFELEDPRPMGLYRIVFTFFLLCNVNGLWEQLEFLFTADGMFSGAEARARFSGGSIFVRDSLLYTWDSAAAFWIHLAAFEVCALLFMIGFRTRLTGVLTLVLMESILVRNMVFWEGTELVYRVFLVYLVCARSGHAYSVDNWLRGRRGVATGYRPIPAWPRKLVLVQLAALFVSTGLAKYGPQWISGDAVYTMLSYEHLPRVPMGTVCALFGTNLLRLMTWIAHAIEVLYPLVLVGLIARWSRARFPPLSGRARTVVRACLLAFVLASTLIVATTGAPNVLPTASRGLATGSWLALWIGVWLAWRLAQRRPHLLGWLFGRRIWAAAAVLLMLSLWLMVNIGQFHPGVLACFLPLLSGKEAAALVHGLVRVARRLGLPIPLPSDEPEASPSPALAYSRTVRVGLGTLLAWHLFAVAVALLPRTEATHAFRDPIHRLTHPWLLATRTVQSWGMWAPSPPRTYVMTPLQVVIVDHDGQAWTVHTPVDPPEHNPVPWIFYSRSHKIARRIASTGERGPYAPAYARWHCRRWARAQGGRPPKTVELRARSYLIPTPEEARAHGPWTPAELRRNSSEQTVLVFECEEAP